jgi:hypothetical protein
MIRLNRELPKCYQFSSYESSTLFNLTHLRSYPIPGKINTVKSFLFLSIGNDEVEK